MRLVIDIDNAGGIAPDAGESAFSDKIKASVLEAVPGIAPEDVTVNVHDGDEPIVAINRTHKEDWEAVYVGPGSGHDDNFQRHGPTVSAALRRLADRIDMQSRRGE